MTQDEWITASEAERSLLEWQLSAHSGPYTSSITGSWTRWDHWKRARTFESTPDSKAAPLRIAQILATWPELEGNAGRRHQVPNGRRLLIPFQPEGDQQSDICIQQCVTCGTRRFFPVTVVNYECATLSGWSCQSPSGTLVAEADRAANAMTVEAPDWSAPSSDQIMPAIPSIDAAQLRQTITGVRIHDCRVDTRLRMPPTYWTRSMMRASEPSSGFVVALDRDVLGRKFFLRFPDPETFFRATARSSTRNFYELLPENSPVCLYLDCEHYTATRAEDNKLDIIVTTVQRLALARWIELEQVNLTPVITTASRQSGALFKHSFHIVFPTIGFSRNNGVLKIFVQGLAALPELQGYGKDGQSMSIVDTKVYSRNQVFRMTESWKFNPAPEIGMVLDFWPAREHTMEHLLSSVVSNVRHVRVWAHEFGKELSSELANLLHAVGIDNLWQESENAYTTAFIPYCLCSFLPVQQARSSYILESRSQAGCLVCQHDVCAAINAEAKFLGTVNAAILDRYRANVSMTVLTQVLQEPSYASLWSRQQQLVEDMPHLTHSEPDWVSADTMSALVGHSVKLNGWRRADNVSQSHTYFLMPNESRKFYNDLEKGHDSDWGFLDNYSTVRAILLDKVAMQWVVITMDSNSREMRLEIAMGSVRSTIIAVLQRWGHKLHHGKAWSVLVLGKELCSDAAHHALIAWATLFEPVKHNRFTGEAASLIRLCALTIIQEGTLPPSAIKALSPLSTPVEWIPAPVLKLVIPTKKKLLQTKLRRTRISPPQMPCHDDQASLPIWRASGCPLEPAYHGDWWPAYYREHRSTRVVSLNVGPVGLRNAMYTIERIHRTNNPGIILLQDCRVREIDKDTMLRTIGAAFPEYSFALACRTQQAHSMRRVSNRGKCHTRYYPMSVAIMVHRSCGTMSIQKGSNDTLLRHQGRILTACVTPTVKGAKAFHATSYYAPTAEASEEQDSCFAALGHRLRSSISQGYVHIVGGDYNASLFPDTRCGYTDSAYKRKLAEADRRFRRFVTQDIFLNRWWGADAQHGLFSWRGGQGSKRARLDEILVLDPTMLDPDPCIRKALGKGYTLRTWHHGNARLDHAAILADITCKLIPPPSSASMRVRTREIIDHKAWSAQVDHWRARVSRCSRESAMLEDPLREVMRWTQIALDEAPKRVTTAQHRRRPPAESSLQKSIHKQIQMLEREVLVLPAYAVPPTRPTLSLTIIGRWKPPPPIPTIALPPTPWTRHDRTNLLQTLQAGISLRRQLLSTINRQQCRERLQRFKALKRKRMDTPKSKEVKTLLGQQLAPMQGTQAKASRASKKRHPDTIHACIACDKLHNWLIPILGPGIAKCIASAAAQRQADHGEPSTLWSSRDTLLDIHSRSASEWSIRLRPISRITDLLEALPQLSDGEHVRVSASADSTSLDCADGLCNEETFFTINAMNHMSVCRSFPKCKGAAQDLIPITKVSHNNRTVKFFCQVCHTVFDAICERDLDPCPVPADLLTRDGLDPSRPTLTTPLTWVDFEQYLQRRPKQKAPGEEICDVGGVTYERWQDGPPGMKIALFNAVEAVASGRRAPVEWEGAIVKLLPKKESEEHVLESNRPICLMATAMKLVTGIWAYRLLKAAEHRGVIESTQEGNRPMRSTRRQVTRLIQCLEATRSCQGSAVVAFLDIENFFNSISLPALFFLLRKIGMARADIAALQQYYSTAYMTIVHGDGTKSARIPLRRGLRQGCPLSPILGSFVVNALIRWLEDHGGGLHHPSGVETSVAAFCDDLTLTTEDVAAMKGLFQRVYDYCQWAGVNINLNKSEVTGFNFRSRTAINTHSLTFGHGRPKHIRPEEPVRYLGIRMRITLDMAAEREYILGKAKQWVKALHRHPYSPRQIDWVIQSVLLSIIRYSAALAQWDDGSLQQLEKVMWQVQREAWRLPQSCPNLVFWAGGNDGVFTNTKLKPLLIKEETALLQQCLALEDDVAKIMRHELQGVIIGWGACSLAEASKECRWHQLDDKAVPYCADTIVGRWLEHVSLHVSVAWERAESHADSSLQLDCPGLAQLLPIPDEQSDVSQAWKEAKRLLQRMTRLGLTRIKDTLDGHTIALPANLTMVGDSCRGVLTQAASQLGYTVSWVDEEHRASELHVPYQIRPGDRGPALIGGRVRSIERRTTHEGVIVAHDTSTEVYTIQFQDFTTQLWTLQQVQQHWLPDNLNDTWTEEDRAALRSRILGVWAQTTSSDVMVTRTPHPTLLSSTPWTKRAVWFTCRMLWDFPPGFREFLSTTGSKNDIRLASDLCTRKAIFWAPKSTWLWKSSSVSNRAGWMVLAESYRVEKGEVLLTVRSLHQDEHHRNGDIRVTSKENGPSIRRLILDHSRRAGLTIVLSEEELGDQTQYTGTASLPQQARTAETPPPPRNFRRTLGNRTTTQETPLVTCEFDFSALKPLTTRWPYNQGHVSVTCRKGQARIIEAPVTSTTAQTGRRHPKGVNIKRSRPLTKTNVFPLDESRWAVLQLETPRENVIQHWMQSWQALTTWEKNGGRTIHWSISTALARHFNLDAIVGGWNLTADPSYPFFHPVGPSIPVGTRALVPLYQYSEADIPMSWLNKPESMWVVMVYPTQLRGNLKRLIQQNAKRVVCIRKGDSVCLKKGWWTTGELKPIQAKGDVEIWCSNNIHDDDFQTPSPLLWVPVPSSTNIRLSTYLQRMPGSQHLSGSIPVAATDGAYRRARDGNISSPMGAGVTWKDQTHPDRSVCVRGNYASSTRAELAAIALALQQANIAETVVLLVDSTAALRRIARFQSRDFRPDWESCKDFDIMKVILDIICARQALGSQTLFVKVHGHSAHPLHTLADTLAVQGTDAEEESFATTSPRGLLVSGIADRTTWTEWGRQAQRYVTQEITKEAWSRRKKGTHMECFLSQENAGRALVGRALRSTWDWAVRCWILSITPGMILRSQGQDKTKLCLCDGHSTETFHHVQLSCLLSHRRALRQTAHNNIAKLFEKTFSHVKTDQRFWVWDKSIPTLLTDLHHHEQFKHALNAVDTPAAVRAWIKAWHSKTTPTSTQLSTLGRQRDPHRLIQHIEPHVERQRPDGIGVDLKDRRVFVIEFVRTDDNPDALRQALVRKNVKYQPLALQLRAVLPNYSVELFTFVIGIRGSINEHLWRRNLFIIGLTPETQDTLIQACMRATVEGTYAVWRASAHTE